MGQLGNISIADFRRFLESQGLSHSHTNGGHEIWKKQGMLRPVVLQTHIEPVPEHVVRNNLRSMKVGRDVLIKFLQK